MARRHAAVVGAGINGLTSAHELASLFDTTVYYASPPEDTTSAIATAIWHVYLVDPSDKHVLRWATETLSELLQISKQYREAGVYSIRGSELFRKGEPHLPTWSGLPTHFRMLTAEDLNSFPGAKWGYELDAPLAEMSQYLPWLKSRAEGLNVMFLRRKLLSLRELVSEYDVVVNCTGLGARKLCSDDGLVGVRGQYVLIDGNSLTPQYYVGDDEHPDGMSYMIPRRDGVCVGGTEEYGVEDLSFNLDVQKLLERVSETSPWLRALSPENVRARYIGLRPYRAQGVRLEAERLDECILVHNYGHGGSGFSLSWGCAREVRELVRMSCEGESIA